MSDKNRDLLPTDIEYNYKEDESFADKTEKEELSDDERQQLEEDFYKAPEGHEWNLTFSVLALIFSILSVVLCNFYYVALPFAILAIVFGLVSRKVLGYFDKITVIALVVGIFGFVFSTFSLVLHVSGLYDEIFGK